MALVSLGAITNGEITAINRMKGSLCLELDSGDEAYLPAGRRVSELDSLREGQELRVLVVSAQTRFGKMPRYIVSQRLDDEVDGEFEGDDSVPAPSAAPNAKLVSMFPIGRKVKGSVCHVAAGAVIVLIAADGAQLRARLPLSELGSVNPSSLRRDVNVNATVLKVDADGLVLTKR